MHLSFKNICIVINVNGWFFAVFFINGFIWYILELHLYIGLNCSTINSEKKRKTWVFSVVHFAISFASALVVFVAIAVSNIAVMVVVVIRFALCN